MAAAWEDRAGSPRYIEQRIRFFQALFEMLDGGDAGGMLREIATAAREPGAQNEWTIQPVLEHLASRLTAEQRELMASLGKALGDSNKLVELDALPAWQRIVAELPYAPDAEM